MVSAYQMDKFSYRILQLILFCFIWQLGITNIRGNEHSSIRFQQEDLGKIYMFVLIVIIGEIGKDLDTKYKCPVYCNVTHKHNYWEKDEEKEGYIQSNDAVSRSDKYQSRK